MNMNMNPMMNNMNPIMNNMKNMNPMMNNMNNMNQIMNNMNPMISNVNPMMNNMNPIMKNMNPMISNMNPMMNNMNPMMNNMNNMNPMMNNMNNMNPMINNVNPMMNNMMNNFEMNNFMGLNPMIMNQPELMGNMTNHVGDQFSNPHNKGKVEEFKIKLHPNIKPRKEYKLTLLYECFNIRKIDLYRCSMSLVNKIEMVDHPVLEAYYLAFLDHYPVVLSPDILWMLVLQGFSHHVRINAKNLKGKFVKNSQNKGKIIVTQSANGDSNINEVSSQRWGDIFKDFVELSKESIDGPILHLFTPYFTTTTPTIEYASQIAIISILNPFVKYIKRFNPNICGGCGFPYINLQGTLQDYKQLKMKIEGLKGYLIDDWINKLISIVDKIIDTKNGKIDKQFWENMITNQERKYQEEVPAQSSPGYITVDRVEIKIFGWIFDFFPFVKIPHGHEQVSTQEDFEKYGQIKFQNYVLARNHEKFFEDSSFSDLPEEMININANYKNRYGKKAELGIKTGFLGYSINENREFQPEIGWYFYIKSDPDNLIKKIYN